MSCPMNGKGRTQDQCREHRVYAQVQTGERFVTVEGTNENAAARVYVEKGAKHSHASVYSTLGGPQTPTGRTRPQM